MRDNPKVARTRVVGILRVPTVRIAFFINHRPFRVTFLSVTRLSTWCRLVTANGACLRLCLTALPLTHSKIDAFIRDISLHACATVVERLIDSPACGERWARQSI